MQQPVQISQLKFEQERRQKLADALSRNAPSKVSSHTEGLAKVLSMGLAGYNSGKADDAAKQYEAAKNEALAKALDPARSRDERIGALAGVPDYQDTAVKAALETPSAQGLKDQAEQALLAQASGQPLTPAQTAALSAYDKMRQTEFMYDPRQNIVPKYGSLLSGQQPQAPAAMPANPPLAEGAPRLVDAPAGGPLLPPPAAGQQGDMSLFNGAQPPQGLDPKAQGQYMDAMAADAAKRAQNGGAPELTERQGKATSFAARMAQAEGEMGNIIKQNPNFNQANVVDNLAAAVLPPQVRNMAISEPYQQLRSAQENWVTGMLRLDSGAAIPKAELENYIAQYFPVAGDNEATIQQKARARQAAIEAVKAESGAGYKYTGGLLSEKGLGEGLPQTPQAPAQGGLTPAEQEELKKLEAMFGGK